MACNIDCTSWEHSDRPGFHGDPDIAGLGIVVVFIASSALSLFLSSVHIYLTPSPSPDDNFIDFWTPEFFPLIVEYLRRPSIAAHRWKCLKAGVPDPSRKATKGQEFGARVIEKIVLNLSDQLLLIGSAVLIAGFWTHCSISVYHFALISDLAWFASTCHLTTVAALEKYLRRRPMFRDWRVFLMACMAILLAASTVMQGHRAWYSSWPFNAQCVFDHYVFADVGGLPARWMYTKLVILFIDYPSSIGLLYQPSRDLWKRWLYTKPRELMQSALDRLQQMRSRKATKSFPMATARRVSCAGCIALVKSSRIACSFIYMLTTSLFASRWTNLLVCVAAFIYGLVGRFQDRNIPREKMDSDENLMTFGQIVPILLLSSTILVAREAYEDVKIEMRNEDLGIGNTSMTDLLHGWSTSMSALSGGQGSETSGDLQVLDHSASARPSLRRLDTEMGGRAQSSGLGGTHPTLLRMRSAHASLSGSQTPRAGI